jgi:hypothetical protein
MFEFFKIKIDQKHFEISVQKYLISNGTESTWGRNDLKPTLVTHLCVSLPSTSTDQGRKVNMKTDGKF